MRMRNNNVIPSPVTIPVLLECRYSLTEVKIERRETDEMDVDFEANGRQF